MAKFSWQQAGDEFHAETRYGTVIIAEHDGVFTWRIEQPEQGIAMRSDVVSSSPPYLDTFEDAERFILMNLAFLTEPPTVDPSNPQGWLADFQNGAAGQRLSFDLGEQALRADVDPALRVRLRLIRAILFEGTAPVVLEMASLDQVRETFTDLIWQQDGNSFHALTRFGKAIVSAQQDGFRWRIEHSSGAILPAGVEGYDSGDFVFATAEESQIFVVNQLANLADPPIVDASDIGMLHARAEVDFPYLAFTLDICAKALPADADLIHLERFEHMKSDLFLKVD